MATILAATSAQKTILPDLGSQQASGALQGCGVILIKPLSQSSLPGVPYKRDQSFRSNPLANDRVSSTVDGNRFSMMNSRRTASDRKSQASKEEPASPASKPSQPVTGSSIKANTSVPIFGGFGSSNISSSSQFGSSSGMAQELLDTNTAKAPLWTGFTGKPVSFKTVVPTTNFAQVKPAAPKTEANGATKSNMGFTFGSANIVPHVVPDTLAAQVSTASQAATKSSTFHNPIPTPSEVNHAPAEGRPTNESGELLAKQPETQSLSSGPSMFDDKSAVQRVSADNNELTTTRSMSGSLAPGNLTASGGTVLPAGESWKQCDPESGNRAPDPGQGELIVQVVGAPSSEGCSTPAFTDSETRVAVQSVRY